MRGAVKAWGLEGELDPAIFEELQAVMTDRGASAVAQAAVWPRYMPDEDDVDQRLQLDPEYEVLESFRREECILWREYAEAEATD